VSTTANEYMEELALQHQAQLLGLGAIALEMHQNGEIDETRLTKLASRIAETERELELRGAA
jgi:hypothetical protein